MADRIQIRRDTAANWASANPVLAIGEQGYETDTGKMKIGNGSSTWNTLSYFADTASLDAATLDGLDSTDFATAAQGALADSAIQSADLATVATTGSYNDLSDQPSIPSITGLATETYVDTAVSNLVDTAPAALDTLNELAAALGDDADFAGSVTTSLAAKANTADLATVATSGSYNDLTDQPVIDAGGSGGTASFTSTTNLTAGDLVALSASGTVSGITTQAQVLYDAPTQPDPLPTQLSNISVAKISDTKYIVAFKTTNNYMAVHIATIEPDNSVSLGTTYTISTPISGTYLQVFWDSTNNVGVLASPTYLSSVYRISYHTFTVTGTAISYTGIESAGNYAKYSVYAYDYENQELWTAWWGENYSARYGGLQRSSWSGSAWVVTNNYSNQFSFSSEKTYNIRAVAVWPGENKVLLQWYDGNSGVYRTIAFDTVAGTWDAAVATDSNPMQKLVYNSVDNIMLGVPYFANSAEWVEHSISGGTVTKGNLFSIPIDSNSNPISWGADDVAYAEMISGKIYVLSYTTSPTAFMYSLERTSQNTYVAESIFSESVDSYNMTYSIEPMFASCGSGLVFADGVSLRKLDFADLSVTNIGDFIGISTETVTANNPAVISIVGGINTNQSGLTPSLKYYATAVGALTTTLTDYPVGIATSATDLLVTESYTSTQKKTDLQLATVATTGAYSDLTGTPDLSSYATETYVDTAVSNLVDTAPEALNTLNELAAALGDDADFAGSVTTSLAAKANTADLATVATSGSYNDLSDQPTIPADVSDLTDTTSLLGGGGGSFEAVASGSLSDGSTVVLNSDGTVSVVDEGYSVGALVYTLDNPNAYNTSLNDYFGYAVAIDGNYAIVGAEYEDDGNGSDSGKAYIFNVTTSALLHTLDNPNAYGAGTGDAFGNKVAISGDYAIVGAYGEADAGGTYSGKAHIFNVTTGALVHTLNNPNAYGTSETDFFGKGVAISGNYAIVSAYREADANGSQSGKAYIFNVTTGALLYTLDNPNAYGTSSDDNFGWSVSMSGDYAIIGARQESDAGGFASGKAYIYNVTTGALVHTLNNPNAYGTSSGDNFGFAAAISGNYAIVGAYQEDDAEGTGSGKAYIFNVTTGALLHTLDNPNPYGTSLTDYFGYSVSIAGNYAIVSAYREDDGGGTDSGKAYIYSVTTGALIQTIDNLNPYGTSASDNFGFSVALSNSHAIIGARNEDEAIGTDSGKAYIYSLPSATTNLTEENYVGISDGAYADGATATIQTAGSVDDAQSGLTPGQAYYVQTNGTLGLTPATPSVFAGTAVSSTKLLIGKEAPASSVAYADVTGTPTLATVATTGSYNDLSDQPSIPSITGLATETYVDTAVSNLVDTAPDALNTLNELAAALNDDADFAGTVTTSLSTKLGTDSVIDGGTV